MINIFICLQTRIQNGQATQADHEIAVTSTSIYSRQSEDIFMDKL